MINSDMEEYYRKRAEEYEKIYGERGRPDRQQDLAHLRSWLLCHTRGKVVLEIAAGTGYWTAVAARVARRIVATDYNRETLALCAAKQLGSHVELVVADAYQLPHFASRFDVCMAHLWWSHVPKERQRDFLVNVASKMRSGAELLMIDENYVDGFSIPVSADETNNTLQIRKLESGETFQIIKNYPSSAELKKVIGQVFSGVHVLNLRYYWALRATM